MIENIAKLWEKTTLEEKRKLLTSILEAIYVDLLATRSVVGIQPKAPFYSVFEALKKDYKVTIFDPNDKKETGSSLYQNPDLGLAETGEAPTTSHRNQFSAFYANEELSL